MLWDRRADGRIGLGGGGRNASGCCRPLADAEIRAPVGGSEVEAGVLKGAEGSGMEGGVLSLHHVFEGESLKSGVLLAEGVEIVEDGEDDAVDEVFIGFGAGDDGGEHADAGDGPVLEGLGVEGYGNFGLRVEGGGFDEGFHARNGDEADALAAGGGLGDGAVGVADGVEVGVNAAVL